MTMTPGASPGSSSFAQEPLFRRPALALVIAALALGAVALVQTGGSGLWRGLDTEASALVAFSAVVAPLAVGVVLAVRLAGCPDWFRRLVGRWTLIDVLAGVSVGLLVRVVMELVAPTLPLSLAAGYTTPLGWLGLAVLIVGTGLIVPVVEELLFRGVLLASLADACGGLGRAVAATVAVIASTAVFVGLHFIGVVGAVPVAQLLAPLLVGAGCGILFVLTGRLGASLLAHVVFNAVGIALVLR